MGRPFKTIDNYRKEATKKNRKIKWLVEILKGCESYQARYNGSPSCPCCEEFMDRETGHHASCELAKAIKD